MIEMSNGEYSEFTKDLFAKFKAGEMTAEEVCAELDKIDGVWFADPRPIADIPTEWSTMIATPIITNKTNDYVTKDTKQVNRGE